MDIQITDAMELGDEFVVIHRTLDGMPHVSRRPKEILAIRAAEYNAEVTDADIIDMVMLEQFITGIREKFHPLFIESIDDAREIVNARIAEAKARHGHPTGKMSSLAFAAASGKATPGLGRTLTLLNQHADSSIRADIQTMRDHGRAQIADQREFRQPTFRSQISAEAARLRESSAPRPAARPKFQVL